VIRPRALSSLAIAAIVTACSSSSYTAPAPAPTAAPVAPAPAHGTVAAIRPDDMRTRMEAYADDSMLGREAGTIGNVKATDYIAAQLRAIGLEPGGDGDSYFQTVPMVTRTVDPIADLTVGGTPLTLWSDFVPVPPLGGFLPFGSRGPAGAVKAVYGGALGDPETKLSTADIAGKLVVLDPPMINGAPSFQIWAGGDFEAYAGAAGLAFVTLDISPPGVTGFLRQPQEAIAGDPATGSDAPFGMLITRRTAQILLGAATTDLKPGATGQTLNGTFRFAERPAEFPARNVIGILRGSDPNLRGQYVAIGAHNDHIGLAPRPVDHDSVRAFNRVVRPEGADSPERQATPQEMARIRAMVTQARTRSIPRRDSIYNGADDDGSGTVTVLEIAEAFAARPDRPKRSLIFVWHTAEEKGLFGAQYFTDHPTVPRDSLVTQLNLDMVGRGGTGDLELGGPGYMQLIGSRRLSTELGDLVERVNTEGRHGFAFDYQYDADGHPGNFYCRSDHYMYARYGIPIVFFSTGGHVDYHQLTDEAAYIDYEKLARVAGLVMDIADHVAAMNHRPLVDKPRPDPHGACQQ